MCLFLLLDATITPPCSWLDLLYISCLLSKDVISPPAALKMASGAAKSQSLGELLPGKLKQYIHHFHLSRLMNLHQYSLITFLKLILSIRLARLYYYDFYYSIPSMRSFSFKVVAFVLNPSLLSHQTFFH